MLPQWANQNDFSNLPWILHKRCMSYDHEWLQIFIHVICMSYIILNVSLVFVLNCCTISWCILHKSNCYNVKNRYRFDECCLFTNTYLFSCSWWWLKLDLKSFSALLQQKQHLCRCFFNSIAIPITTAAVAVTVAPQ